jgi:hypothetical protein
VREYRNVGGGQVGSNHYSNSVTLRNTWQKITVDVVNGEADTHLDLQVLNQPNVASEKFLVDNVSIVLVPKP